MEMKPRIFIGSSSEGYPVADKIAGLLSDMAECTLWKEMFELNKSNLENLSSQVALFDYAILVATADDVTLSRKRKQARRVITYYLSLACLQVGLEAAMFFMSLKRGLKSLPI